MRSLLFVTGSRADFGLWVPVLRAARNHPDLDPRLLVTAMHLDARFGLTVEEVRRSGFPIIAEVESTPSGDSRADMAAAVGVALSGIAPVLEADQPDWLLVLGDRGEQLAAVIAAAHLGIAIAHVAGGDRTYGAVDDTVRDMITRGAHLHFATSSWAAERLARLGEARWRVKVVGSPGLDGLRELADGDPEPVRRRWGLPATGSFVLVLQHPETRGHADPLADLDATLAAVDAVALPSLAIMPNADAGARAMRDRLIADPGARSVATSVPRRDFAILLANAAVLIGNSSAGLTEAALLRVPAVNIGQRQAGRLRGDNVIDVAAEPQAIEAGVRRALDPVFRSSLSGISPHGEGFSAERIVETLARERIDDRLLLKIDP